MTRVKCLHIRNEMESMVEIDTQTVGSFSVYLCLFSAFAAFTILGYGDRISFQYSDQAFTSFTLFIGLSVFAVITAINTTALLEVETISTHGTRA